MKKIYRGYRDLKIYQTCVEVECPYCGAIWDEIEKDSCGTTYNLRCDDVDGCDKEFEMHFDAD